jgi:exosortase
LNAIANPPLQRMTAWGATVVLRVLSLPARRQELFISLPTVRLEVEPWCSGIVSMKWLTLLAIVLAFVVPGGIPWKAALIIAAPLIALECNILRVAAIGYWIESFGDASRVFAKEWASWGAIAFGVVQLAGLAWLLRIATMTRQSHT